MDFMYNGQQLNDLKEIAKGFNSTLTTDIVNKLHTPLRFTKEKVSSILFNIE